MVTNAQQTKYDTSSTHLHANREKHWASVFLPELSQVLADKCEVEKFSGVLWLSRFSSTEQHIPITAFLSSFPSLFNYSAPIYPSVSPLPL